MAPQSQFTPSSGEAVTINVGTPPTVLPLTSVASGNTAVMRRDRVPWPGGGEP